MEELEIRQLWHTYDLKLEKSLQLNQKIIREIQTQKAANNINSFRRNQVFGVIAGILWIALLLFLVLNTLNNVYFVISVGLIALFNIFAVAAYIRHLALLSHVNVEDSVTVAQQKLSVIQSSLNNVGRILILQAPLYCTFWYNNDLVKHGGAAFWTINLVIVSGFIVLSVYLFRKLTYKNIHIKWVKAFIGSFGGKQLIKAMEFLKEIEEYRVEG